MRFVLFTIAGFLGVLIAEEIPIPTQDTPHHLEQFYRIQDQQKVESEEEFSSSIDLIAPSEEENIEYAILEEQQESDSLRETAMELDQHSSLEGMIAQDTAKIIHETYSHADTLPDPDPTLIDLSEILEIGEVTTFEIPSVENSADQESPSLYETLPITVEDKQKIGKLLVTMAENNWLELLFKRNRLERLGQEINHVHPIRFVGTILSNPRLVHCMKKIQKSGLKWNGFMDGFTERFLEEVKAGNVDRYIPSFAQHYGISANDIQAYINYRDFEGLITFLLDKRK